MPNLTVLAALGATALFLAMGAFQAALAAGAPLGDHVLGGRFPPNLPNRLRLASAIAAILLAVFALVVLARAGVVASPLDYRGPVAVACWVIAGFLTLNTLSNLTSKSRLERTVFAGATAALAVLSAFVAWTG
ncbi:MAG: hypothetical protein QOH61_1537 [Chloroflexota bacterium]|jgi:hypothetical protein|nr:hypothetical protein [Chloroflexota bacterium]